jgi:hypothetical protein
MAVRLKHSESITVGKEGIKLGGSFSLTSDELAKMEGKDVAKKVRSVKEGIEDRVLSSARFIGHKRSQVSKLVRNAPMLNRSRIEKS